MILAGDVGATKILLEAGDLRSGHWKSGLARRYQVDDFANFHAVLARFLEEWQVVKPRRARITAAGIGVAGFAQGNKVTMTHRPWIIDGDAIARRFGFARVRVVNDLAAAAHGVVLLGARDTVAIQPGKAVAGEPRVVIGVGTGLGVAYLVPRGDSFAVLPGEGGHVGFSPASAQQCGLWGELFALHGRVEVETVISGIGIANIHRFLQGSTQPIDPAAITEGATRGDAGCIETLGLFSECLGNLAGDHALAVMARGGVFLAGGVMARITPLLDTARFRAAFCAKGAFSSHLMKIPVRAITTERLAVLGAARLA